MVEQAFGVYQKHQQIKMQEKMAQRQADIAAQNRKSVHAAGVAKEAQMRTQQRRVIGAQRASMAQAGLFGVSAFEGLEESMVNAEMDILNSRTQALQQGANFQEQQNMALFRKKQLGQQARTLLVTAGMSGVSGAAQGGMQPIAPQGQGSKTAWANPDLR
jgi:hypothetical protein